MKSDIACRLADLNRAFYQTFAAPFSATRGRIQPGARRLLARIPPLSAVADLGCGNANAARWLAAHNPPCRYLGLDLSDPLLEIARSADFPFPAEFRQADFFESGWDRMPAAEPFGFVLAFAVLHHIPDAQRRLAFLRACRRMLVPGGWLFLSTWQFRRSPKLRMRTVAWEEIGLSESDVDSGDYLLDWRSEGRGLRYVHIVDERERSTLAEDSEFTETERFESDGEGGRLADYAVWTPV
ncbi:MAG: class I SAM-dependent methyltransferase [Anaerolineales bacterium]|nr:class I SAM-dependent methyltransferase [Anaerolineales bacterium]